LRSEIVELPLDIKIAQSLLQHHRPRAPLRWPLKRRRHDQRASGFRRRRRNLLAKSGRKIFDHEHFYLPTQGFDPLGNENHAEIDYRLLSPCNLTDVNGTTSYVENDILGMVTKTAIVGPADEGNLRLTPGSKIIPDPASILEYDLYAFAREGNPTWVRTKTKETYLPDSRWQESVAYSDGAGNVVQSKARIEDGC
jgi:hypothetical protein